MGFGDRFGRGFGLERGAERPMGNGPQQSIHTPGLQLIKPSPGLHCDENAARASGAPAGVELDPYGGNNDHKDFGERWTHPGALEHLQRGRQAHFRELSARVMVCKPATFHDIF